MATVIIIALLSPVLVGLVYGLLIKPRRRRREVWITGPTLTDAQHNEITTWVCAECHQPLESWSAENDYTCKVHGFVNAIAPDGRVILGDGRVAPFRTVQ